MGVILGKKVHRTPKNLYILNLGISGLSTSVICLPPTLAQCLYGGKWFLGLAACKLVPTMQGTNVLVAAGTITAIAIDRWWSITQTSGQANQLTMRKVAAINFVIWLVSFLICSPILVFQDLQLNPYPNCMEFWPHPQMKNAFTILVLCRQYLLPIIVLPVVHSQILAFLERNSGLAIDARRQERERKRNKRMTFVLSCIAITFAVSFLPLHLFFTVTDLGLWGIIAQNIKMYYFILCVCHCVAFSSCVSNPVLYGWLNTNLRKEFLKVLPGWMVPTEDCSTTTTQLIKCEAST